MAVFLDYNATTPVDLDVQAEICAVLKRTWGNPSSTYELGKEAKFVVEDARLSIAEMIGAKSEEILFTSGGTESNNMVIQTILRNYKHELQNGNIDLNNVPHIITTNIEHDSVMLPLRVLADKGKADVTFVPISKETGIVDVNDIINAIRPNTRLITVMLANNETGMIQPVPLFKDYLESFKKKIKHPIYLHTDAAQAIGKISVDVQELGVDYMTIVGHKFYGPRIGALYYKNSCPLEPLFYGGGQEKSYRPGTENTCMIAGLGKASQLVKINLKKYKTHMMTMRNYLEESLKNEFPGKVVIHFKSDSMKLPNTLSVAFDYDNISGKALLNEASNIYASTGAACHSGGKPSAVLLASGVPEVLASKTLRLSVGRETTRNDIDLAVKCLKEALSKLLNTTS